MSGLLLVCASTDPRDALAEPQWIDADAPDGRKIRAFVARPKGDGPFPIVVVLHGTDGFRQRYVYLAQDLARHGFVAVAGCWFGGHYFWRGRIDPSGSAPHQDAIHCPRGPEFKAASLPAKQDVLAIVEAARKLPGVQPRRVGLFGHSRG
ncbi:MAG: dienelactone hydrolase family protein, partial [Candidatus Rokubacteria bacterium]|nr:dienelactone hydrolase family protein [Candidatus Rokubacteria bacterium]